MTVKIEKLVRMAEQITANMAYTEDKEIVAERVCDHLSRFWDPRMLAAIKDYHSEQAETLSAELSTAIARLEEQ